MNDAPTLIEKATRIAVSAHVGQVRKNDQSPYIVHPFMCAIKLAQYGFSDEVVAASLVHDVLEDTEVTVDELLQELGKEVVDIVKVVSEDKTLVWEERKQKYVEMVGKGSEGAKAVCIVDKIHNAQSTLFSYSKIGSVVWGAFNRGKEKKLWFDELCLAMFKQTWRHPLIEEYEKLVEKMRSLE
jgi:guanosine-3',5'-bis(diphosphate) 3'-pyrophosphohydrolase